MKKCKECKTELTYNDTRCSDGLCQKCYDDIEKEEIEERIKKVKKQFKDGEISETQMYDNIYAIEEGEM